MAFLLERSYVFCLFMKIDEARLFSPLNPSFASRRREKKRLKEKTKFLSPLSLATTQSCECQGRVYIKSKKLSMGLSTIEKLAMCACPVRSRASLDDRGFLNGVKGLVHRHAATFSIGILDKASDRALS